jgi:SIR2-like domain/TIR domain
MQKSDSCGAGGSVSAGGHDRPSLKVFINYRHDDTKGTAAALYMKLEERFGAENVFYDNSSLQPGMRWFDEIRSQLSVSGAVVALIGPQWTSILTDHLQRGGDDYVVKEIDLALRGGPLISLIPVLVDDAVLPDSRALPPALKALPRCQAEYLRHTTLEDDISRLIERLDAVGDAGDDQPRPVIDSRPSRGPTVIPLSPPPVIAPPPDEDHYRMVTSNAGNLVVFLGSGANPDDDAGPWLEGDGRLPNDRELAQYLAAHAGLESSPPHLAEVAQYAGARHGEPELFEWVREVLRVDSAPGPVHRALAGLPERLGGRYQMIVTPKYDAALEKAFAEQNEDFDVVVYMAPGTEPAGRFVHIPWYASPQCIDKPNEYTGLPVVAEDLSLQRTVIVRINGAVNDPDAGFPWQDNYVITEDHYIDYFSGRAAEEIVPGQILAKLRRANCLFLGYTIADWRLRVFLQRVWKGPRLGRAKYWAVEYDPDVLERDLWQQAGVSLYQIRLTDYLNGLYSYLDDHPAAQP